MTLIWLTVVVGVFNICLGFALGVYVQGKRHVPSSLSPEDEDVPMDLDLSPYRSFAEGIEDSADSPDAVEQVER